MRTTILLIILFSLLFSCNSNNEKAKNELKLKDQKEQEKISKSKILNDLATQSGAVGCFDTLRFSLTCQYQMILEKNNKIMVENFKIHDIVKIDSTYIISIEKGHYPKLFFELTCSANQVQKLLLNISQNRRNSEDKIIIAAITSIKKVKFRISTDVENSGNEDEEPDVSLELGTSNNFILKGQLINVLKD